MATSKGHNLTEYYDEESVLEQKVDELVDMIRASNHLVFFTGAGVSTAAKIPDFRGPQGVWTMRDQGKSAKCEITMEQATPTLTHMAMVALHREGIAKYTISQNVDGLHRRSGIPPEALSELHGNCFIEVCQTCGRDYVRDFDCSHSVWDRKKNAFDHRTGRHCACGGELGDSIIHFGENLPEAALAGASKHSRKADLVICVGSSLLVTPAAHFPAETHKRGGKLVIMNLQETGLDDIADLIIHEKCDKVFSMLMERLAVPIPSFVLSKNILIGNDHRLVEADGVGNTHEWNVFVKADVGQKVSGLIESVDFELHPTFNPRVVTVSAAPFQLTRVGWGTFDVKMTIHLKAVCAEDTMVVTHTLSFDGPQTISATIPVELRASS